jgi:hypothetical protein
MMLLAALQDFANGSPVRDDVSLTVIQRDAKCADLHPPLQHDLAALPSRSRELSCEGGLRNGKNTYGNRENHSSRLCSFEDRDEGVFF